MVLYHSRTGWIRISCVSRRVAVDVTAAIGPIKRISQPHGAAKDRPFRNGHQLDTARNLRTLYHWSQAYAVPVPIAIGRLEVIVLKIDFAQKGVANAAVRGVTDKIGTSGRKLIGQTNAGQAEKACRPDRSNPIVGNGTWNRPRAVHESIDSNGCRQTVVLSEIAERLSPSRSRGRRWGRRRDPTVSSKVRARGIFSELVQRSV